MDSDGSDREDDEGEEKVVYEDQISKVYVDSHGTRRLVLKSRDSAAVH